MKQARIPATARSGVALNVRSLACMPDGSPLEADTKVNPGRISSRLVVELRASSESAVHRVAALVLLQAGGCATFSLTRHDSLGGYHETPMYHAYVQLPVGSEVVL